MVPHSLWSVRERDTKSSISEDSEHDICVLMESLSIDRSVFERCKVVLRMLLKACCCVSALRLRTGVVHCSLVSTSLRRLLIALHHVVLLKTRVKRVRLQRIFLPYSCWLCDARECSIIARLLIFLTAQMF